MMPRKHHLRYYLIGIMTVLITLVMVLKFSSGAAAYIVKLPGMEPVVHLIKGEDKHQTIHKNRLIQPLRISETHHNIELIIEGLLADEGRVVVFYRIQDQDPNTYHMIADAKVFDMNGELTNNQEMWFSMTPATKYTNPYSGYFIVDYGMEYQLPKQLDFQFSIINGRQERVLGTWNVQIPIVLENFPEIIGQYPVEQTVTIQKQLITIDRVNVQPTRMEVDVVFDPDNSHHIYEISDLHLVDELGNIYGKPVIGISSKAQENRVTYYLEGSYTHYPEQLILRGSQLNAILKEDKLIRIDMDLLTMENHRLIQLEGIRRDFEEFILVFSNKGSAESFRLASEFIDGNGEMFSIVSENQVENKYELSIPIEEYISPLQFTIRHYPALLRERFTIEVR